MSTNKLNVLTTTFRSALTAIQGYTHGGERNLFQTFGWKRNLESLDYYALYQRLGIANRAVCAFPQSTWSNDPIVFDDAGRTAEESSFVDAVEKFVKEQKVYHYLERADRLSGIGNYSILVLGFADGLPLDQPLARGNKKLVYMRPYMDISAKVCQFEQDETSERYGLPVMYTVSQSSDTNKNRNGQRSTKVTFNVHYTRVLHIAEFLDEDDIYGTPRLEPVYNDLVDLQKVGGAAPELFWLNGRGGLGLWADKEAELDDAEKTAISTQADEYLHQLRRIITGKGMTAQPIQFAVPDPKNTIETKLDLIAGGLGIPKRILLGSERGELSSAQDENNFNARVKERQSTFAIPMIVEAFIQKMIETGNLPEPKGEFQAEWDHEEKLNPKDKAEINLKKTQALVAYSNSPNSEFIVPQEEFRADFLEISAESEYDFPEVEELDETQLPENLTDDDSDPDQADRTEQEAA